MGTSTGETHGGRWDHAGGGGASRNSREGRGIESERDGILELGIDDINRWLLNIMIETEIEIIEKEASPVASSTNVEPCRRLSMPQTPEDRKEEAPWVLRPELQQGKVDPSFLKHPILALHIPWPPGGGASS